MHLFSSLSLVVCMGSKLMLISEYLGPNSKFRSPNDTVLLRGPTTFYVKSIWDFLLF